MGMKNLDLVVKAIAEAKEITPRGHEVKVFILGGTGLNAIYPQELKDILLKLQDDEGIIKIKSFPEWLVSEKFTVDVFNQSVNATLDSSKVNFTIETLNGFDEWCADHFAKRASLTKNLLPKQEEKVVPQPEIVYQITYTPAREILLNDDFQLAKPDFAGENDTVFGYLYENPNVTLSKEQIEEAVNISLNKSFHKIVENLGFRGDLKRVFFNVSKTSILFRNPITREDLEDFGITRIKLP